MKIVTTVITVMLIGAGLGWVEQCRAEQRPNILYIMSDDHAAHAISAYGGRLAEVAPTPNIDRLAKEGALFTNAYCTNSICSPSRACVLTGQYDHVNGAFDLSGEVLPGKQMLAIEMKRAGYHTAMIGKWHLKAEPADFDYYCVLPGQGEYHNPEFLVRGDKPWGKNRIKFGGKHSTDAITDLTIDWLKTGWDRNKPFFLMHHYKAPHDYFDNALRYESYLADIAIPEPETLWKRDPRFGSMATRAADDELIPHIGTSIGSRNPRRSYLLDLPKMYPNEFPANYDPAHLGIRTKTHKLIYYYGCNYDGGYQTPPDWELYDLVNDPHETRNLYDDPEHVKLVVDLKGRLAMLRNRVGDDGSHFPKCEAVVQEFWDYDETDRAKARDISHRCLER